MRARNLGSQVFVLAAALLSFAAAAAPGVPVRSGAGDVPDYLTVGVIDTLLDEEPLQTIRQGFMDALGVDWESLQMVPLLEADAVAGIERLKPDFVLGPADMDLQFRAAGSPAPFRVVTRKTRLAADASRSTGSLLVVRADRKDLNDLADLRGKRVAATLPSSLPGWLALQGEVQLATSQPPDAFWGKTLFLNMPFPDALSVLFAGNADAAILPTCYWEQLLKTQEVDTARLRPVHEKTDDALGCRRSTDLFPDISVWAFPWTHEKTVRALAIGLLTRQADAAGYEWLSFVPHGSVEELYRALQIGPYAYLRDTSLAGFYRRHSLWIQAAFGLILILILYEIRLQRLVRRRTGELSDALARQVELERESRLDRKRMGALERRTVVSQMSAMIAHEIRSPVGAISNFKAILDFVLPESVRTQDTVKTALEGIGTEAERITGIVSRVRNYAKSRQSAHSVCSLTQIAANAVRSLEHSFEHPVAVCRMLPGAAWVNGDPLELELMLFNLLKNAAEVTSKNAPLKKNAPAITLRIAPAGDGSQWQIEVSDAGPKVSDEAFAHLTDLLDSVKHEGLGLGLSIVRGIADSHGAALHFERRAAGGLTVRVTLDAADAPASVHPAAPERHSETQTKDFHHD